MKKVVEKKIEIMMRNTIISNDETDDNRELQVVFGGLKSEIDEENITTQMKAILNSLGVADTKLTKMFCYSDPASLGVLQFKTRAGKFGFLKKYKEKTAQWLNGDKMWWTSNDTIKQRNIDKTLGMIKHKLHQSQRLPLKTIKIKWEDRTVEVQGKTVATVDEEGGITTEEETASIKEAVCKYMEEWRAKRGWDESL